MLRTLLWMAAILMLAPVVRADEPAAVVLDLGPLEPTPVPTAEPARRVRLITSFTMQNKPDGGSIISFEATDMAKRDKKDYRVIATDIYNLLEEEDERKLGPLRERILLKIRDLERELLDYVEEKGGPRERAPITSREMGGRPQ